MVRQLGRDVLRMKGYTVLEASNGGEALLLCERHSGSIDLMVTDVIMPHVNGVELFARVSPLRPKMAVLYMSGYTEVGVVQQGVLNPGMAFLHKPFTPDSLLQKVREVLDAPVLA